MSGTIEIPYKCRCMSSEVSVQVPFRRDGEDIVEWMQSVVQPSLYLDHRRRAPLCMAKEMEYAKIPAPENAPYIGGRPMVQ